MRLFERADLGGRPPCPRLRPEQLGLHALGMHGGAVKVTNGPVVRRERAWISRATTSLPAPAGPVMSTRLPVGATRSIAWRKALIAGALPTISVGSPARSFSSSFSRLSRAASIARWTTSSSRSALKGFSIKS